MPLPVSPALRVQDISQCPLESSRPVFVSAQAILVGRLSVRFELPEVCAEFIQLGLNAPMDFVQF